MQNLKLLDSVCCKSCGVTKNISEASLYFYHREGRIANSKSFWHKFCKACCSLRAYHRRISKKDEIREKQRSYAEKNKKHLADYKKRYYNTVGKFNNKVMYEKHKEKRKSINLRKRLENASEEQKKFILHKRWVSSLKQEARFIYNRFKVYKYRSLKEKLPFDLTYEFLIELLNAQNFLCYYSKQLLELKKNTNACASLDRIDSKKGYTKDNVRWSCLRVNLAKNDMSEIEFLEMCKDVVKNFNT